MEIEKTLKGYILKTRCPIDTIHDKYDSSFPVSFVYLTEHDLERLFEVTNQELLNITLGKDNA